MYQQVAFGFYFLTYQLTIILLGLNCIRIRERFKVHPRISSFIIPLLVNYFMGNFVFKGIPPIVSLLLPCVVSLAISVKLEKVRILGITGSIATGKSTLTRLIRNNYKDIDIIDCDEISRKLRKKGEPGYKLILSLLGQNAQQYLNPLTQQIEQQQRKKLNEYVFTHPEFRNRLTRQMGKLIIYRVFGRIAKNIITGKNVMMIDAPLLYESKILERICFPVVVVGCSEAKQIARLTARDGYTEEQAKKRIQSQMPLTQKIKKCQVYLANEDTEASLIAQFNKRIKRYLSSEIPKDYMVPDKGVVKTKKTELRQEEQDQ